MSRLLVLLAALGGAPDDQADLLKTVQSFYAAAAKKDPAAAAAVWSPTSPQLEAIRDCVAHVPTPITDYGAGPFSVKDDVATARVHFKGRLTNDDGKYADETVTRWRAKFHREGGAWKWFDLEPEGQVVARELCALKEKKERRAYLEAHQDAVGLRAVMALVDGAVDLVTGGNPDAAGRAVDAALEAAEFADRDELRAPAWMTWGICLATLSKPGVAIPALKKAKEFNLKIRDSDSASMSGSWLGFALMDAGRTDEALVELAASLKLAQAPEFAESRFFAENFTGLVHCRRGATALGLTWHERATSTAEKAKRPDLFLQGLHEVGRARWELGDFGGALAVTLSGLKLAEDPEQAPMRAKLLNLMGLIYLSAADYPKARERMEAALAIWMELKILRTTGTLLSNLGEIYRLEGKYPEAVERLEAALQILDETGDVPMSVAAHNNLGVAQRMQGNLDAALAQYRICVRDAAKIGNAGYQVAAMVNIGDILLMKGESGEAIRQLEAALPLAEKSGLPPYRLMAYAGLGQACLARGGPGDLERGVVFLRKATATLEGSRSGLRDPALQQSFLSQHATLYYLLGDALHELKRDAEAFAAAEEGKARTLVDLLEAGSLRIVKSMSDEERGEEGRREAGLRALVKDLDAATLTDDRAVLEERIAKARIGLEEYRREIFVKHPELEGLRGRFSPASLEELNRRLLSGPPRSAVLSYLLGVNESLLFVLTPGKETATLAVHRIPLKLEKLKEDVEAFWSACSVGGGDYRGLARSLHGALIGPAEKSLEGLERVFIIPDGVLNTLPFQALLDKEGRHLVERFNVGFAPSATALLKMGELAAKRRSDPSKDLVPLLAVGAPEMPPGFGDLAHAKSEVEAIAKRYGVTPMTGGDATETRVKPALEKARRVLIATHGKVNEASPLYSFVVLGRDEANDGLLHANEIVDLNLRADLVVLSACETALGRQIRGEGVVGLTWALFAAGTPATVLSQWQVSDESTGQLMESFIEGIQPGVEFSAALRQSQLRLLKNPKWAHPYYWAPFILIGAGRG